MAHFHGRLASAHLHNAGAPPTTAPAPSPAASESPTAFYRRNARNVLAGRSSGDGAEVMLAIAARRRR